MQKSRITNLWPTRTPEQLETFRHPRARLNFFLLKSRISEGRIGSTYAAKVLSATVGGTDVTNTLPESVCLKFAKKQYFRSLARQAWFYERLAACQGTSVARCFGFLTPTLGNQEKSVDNIVL